MTDVSNIGDKTILAKNASVVESTPVRSKVIDSGTDVVIIATEVGPNTVPYFNEDGEYIAKTLDEFGKILVEVSDIDNKINTGIDERLEERGIEFDAQLENQQQKFVDKQIERNVEFGVEQNLREEEFNAFILSSGYAPLGEYKNGPYTFEARTQYIQYLGQYYKLNKFTEVGYTTVGTDAASFAIDVLHFVLMDGDTIRQSLNASDGQKMIGEYSSISSMRNAVMDYNGQKVKLRSWSVVDGSSLIDVVYVYDSSDKTTPDDDYRTVVTSGGQRLKALLPGAIDLRIAGLDSTGDNLGTVLKKVIAAELAKVLNLGSAMKMASVKIPALTSFADPDIGAYNAILDASVVLPSFTPIEVDGNYYVKFNLADAIALKITNSIPGVTPALIPWRDMKSVKMFSNPSGHFELVGPGANTSTAIGMQVGNASAGESVLDLRGLTIEDIQIRAFKYGLDFIWNDTYILKFENIELTGNYSNISSLIAGKVNSGENIQILKSLLADSVSHQITFNSPGIGLEFGGSSIDYAGGSVFYLDNGARGNNIATQGGHIEGWGGMLVMQVAQSVAWFGYPNSVTFNGTQIKAAGNAPGVWASRRKILHSGATLSDLGTKVMFNHSPIYWPAPASEPHVALMGYTDVTPQYLKAIYNCPNSPYPDCLTSYRQSSNKGLYRFTGTVGQSILSTPANPNLYDSTTGYTFTTNGAPTVVYGDVDADGFQHIIVNLDATTTWLEISNKGLFYALEREAEINTAISVMMENVTEGTLTLNTRFRYFYGSAKTADGYEDGPTKNLTALLTATYNGLTTPLTIGKYVGEQSALSYIRQDSAHPIQAEYVQPGIVLRGAVGRIRIKLPVIWTTKGRGSAFVFS